MPILPVLDIRGGLVVRGIAGRRSEYRPIVSRLVAGAAPLDIARALSGRFGFKSFYVADLDAIGGAAPALDLYRDLHATGFQLWVDAGLRHESDADVLVAAGVSSIIAGLESVASPTVLEALARRLQQRLVFSLDLKEGRPLGNPRHWPPDAWSIGQRALDVGVRRFVVLDLARVGVGHGCGTEELCGRLRREWPDIEITAGGGVRGMADVQRLYDCGVDHVLVASALHDGAIAPTTHGRHS